MHLFRHAKFKFQSGPALLGRQFVLTAVIGFLLPQVAYAQSGPAPQIPGLIVAVPGGNDQPGVPASSLPPGARPSILGGGGVTVPSVSRAAPVPSAPKKPTAAPPKKRSASNAGRSSRRVRPGRKHGVAILVNDEPITHHEIDQRARLLAMNGGNIGSRAKANFKALIQRKSTSDRLRGILQETIEANRGRSRDEILAIFERRKKAYAQSLQKQAVASARASLLPKQRSRARDELIEERLKLQEAKRLNVIASAAQVDQTISRVAKRNKQSPKQFLSNIERNGVGAATFKERLRAQISWAGVVRRQFGRIIAVNMADVDRHVASVGGSDGVTLRLQKITLALPNSLGQAAMARRLQEGEQIRARFGGCNTTKLLVRSVSDARFEDLGQVKSSAVPEPARSLLVQAKDGEMLPPQTDREGVVLYAVCGRNTGGAKAKARDALQQREFEIMGRRHLADLKRDAHIEYR